MGTTIILGIMENKTETTTVYWGYILFTIQGLGFGVLWFHSEAYTSDLTPEIPCVEAQKPYTCHPLTLKALHTRNL